MNAISATSASDDPLLQLLVEDRARVVDRGPRVLGDRGDRGGDGPVFAGGDREVGAVAAGGGDDLGAVVGASPPAAPPSRSTPQARVVLIASATSRAAPRAEFADPLRSRVATITGAADALETVASSAFNPLTPE